MLLAGSLALLSALGGSRARGLAVWTAAGTFGAALGPALGGILTQLFDWRAIFVFQAPVALLALVAAFESHEHPSVGRGKSRRFAANLGLALVFGALVGALFLAVLLVITVWGLTPIEGALVVSALPLAALGARPLTGELSPRRAAAGGALLLAGGLLGLALLPSTSTAFAACSLALCGVGLGLAVPSLTRRAVQPDDGLVHDGTITIGARHAGLVVALALVAPLLSHSLQNGARDALLGATRVALDGNAPIRQKVPIALDLRNALAKTPKGKVPDLAAPFDKRGAATDPQPAPGARRADRSASGRADPELPLVVRAFRAARGARARADPGGSQEGGRVTTRRGTLALAVLGAAAAALIALELALGALSFGQPHLADPCTSKPAFSGGGLDGATQRFALETLAGAACQLHTTREELVLSFVPNAGTERIHWDQATIDAALKAGLDRAAEDTAGTGFAGQALAYALRELVAPSIAWFLGTANGT